jgi:hypothetical protein
LKCNDGYTQVTQCPKQVFGAKFSRDIRLISHAMQDKILPDSGGINDQGARFVGLWQAFKSDVNMIEKEVAKRGQ